MSYAYVLDCSVAMSWLFHDEQMDDTLALRDYLKKADAIVPSIWPLEVGNVLWVAEKKGRISVHQSTQFKNLLEKFPIIIDHKTAEYALNKILELSREYKITVYDASYLELSLRFGCPLATLDHNLQKVALKTGTPVLPKIKNQV